MPLHFSQCESCGTQWPTRDHLLHDPELEIIEYQVDFNDFTAGIFIFHHTCGSNLSLPVRKFNGLYEGTVFNVRVKDAEDCPDYCLYRENLEPCEAKCECAYVRNIIGIIKNWPKNNPAIS